MRHFCNVIWMVENVNVFKLQLLMLISERRPHVPVIFLFLKLFALASSKHKHEHFRFSRKYFTQNLASVSLWKWKRVEDEKLFGRVEGKIELTLNYSDCIAELKSIEANTN